MNEEVNKINHEIRTLRKILNAMYVIEHEIFKVPMAETDRVEAMIERLEKRRYFIKHKNDHERICKHNEIDINNIKAIPIRTILECHGVQILRNNFFKARPKENTASAQFNEEKNVWHDFGDGAGGSCIDLIMQLNGFSVGEAIKYLNDKFS